MDGSANVTLTISLGANVVTNTDLADMGANTIKGAVTEGDPVDLTPAQARAILNVEDGATKGPIGAVAFIPHTLLPNGWLKANGAAISRTTYAKLFALIGTTYGAGDGSTTFNLPDLRG